MRPLASILVGVDFTPCSAFALREAVRIATLQRSQLHVVHVIDTEIAIELEAVSTPLQQGIRDGLVAEARRAWLAFVPEAANLPIEISIEHRLLGLIRKAHETRADLIVLGAYGDQRPEVGAGTVATSCVRRSGKDVLLVRDTHSGPFRTIVAGVDFSEASMRALERAMQMALQDQCQLLVVHVFDAPWNRLHYRTPTVEADPQFMQRYTAALEQRLREFAHPALKSMPEGVWKCEVFDGRGHRSGIVRYAELAGADLICLGTRGRSNIRDLFLGSTAEKVLLQSRCSVLAVAPDPAAAEAMRP